MIICSCTNISSSDIERAVDWMRAADPQVIITPGKVYRALGKKPVCGGCSKLFVAAVHKDADNDVPADLRNLRMTLKGTWHHEGRRKGYRLSE